MDEDKADAVLKLPRTLDFAAAESFLETMRSRLQENPRLRIDASGVEVLTVPCIQIILSALQTYEEIALENPSAEFVNAFQDLGIDCRYRAADEIEPAATTPDV
jgi:anti-anti-sigma regulatory factor